MTFHYVGNKKQQPQNNIVWQHNTTVCNHENTKLTNWCKFHPDNTYFLGFSHNWSIFLHYSRFSRSQKVKSWKI